MGSPIACSCGQVVAVSDDNPGSFTFCTCGRVVSGPSLSLFSDDGSAGPPDTPQGPPQDNPVVEFRLAEEPLPRRQLPQEIFAPTQIDLCSQGGKQPDRRARVMAALTHDAIWFQDTYQLRRVELANLTVESKRMGKHLVLKQATDPSAEKLILTFSSAAEGAAWHEQLLVLQGDPTPQQDGNPPDGVALVRHAPEVEHTVVGRVEHTALTPWAADRGLQLRAGILGANAVIDLYRHKVPDTSAGTRHVSGLAVRVEGADGQQRLRWKWYTEEVARLVQRMLILLVFQAGIQFVFLAFLSNTSVNVATGENESQALASAVQVVALVYSWPLILLALMRLLLWPQLLRVTGLAVMAATAGRGLVIFLLHGLAILTTGASPPSRQLALLFDPFEWAFILYGLVLGVQAWRLAGDARRMLPQPLQAVPTARTVCSRGLLAVTCVGGLVLLGYVGHARYEASVHLLQPGVDPVLEQRALLAMNEGASHADREDVEAAGQSYQRALGLWETLTKRRSPPTLYRLNLLTTLYNLGWVRHRQGRADEAIAFYSRAVALAEELEGNPLMDNSFKPTVAAARQGLADLQSDKQFQHLDAKEQAAVRQFEEGQVKSQKGDAAAEACFQEAIALWEEILPQATSEAYRKQSISRLATTYFLLADVQQEFGKRAAAEATIEKGIDYGEKAVALEPDRPLPRHQLDRARQVIERLREEAVQEQVVKLCQAERFAEAIELNVQSIQKLDRRIRSDKNPEAVRARLATRLSKFAWLLAHCPDKNLQDARTAIRHAGRATQLQPKVGDHWYTLATVQYRSGNGKDCLASLEKLKALESRLDAGGWFLSAMALHKLKRREEAQTALRKGIEWMDDRKRQAEDNPLLRFQFELARPSFEALQREAEYLIVGKGITRRPSDVRSLCG